MAAARSSGSKLVASAVAATVGAVGIGTIYLPYVADRDQMRGMHEESSPPTSAMLAQEIKKLQQEGLLQGDDVDNVNIAGAKPQRKEGGSMWARFSGKG